jgi:murein DD-endopeptidase MepM/ murein hydrolase activator NlpD
MAKNSYTVLIFSQRAAQVKKLILSPLTLKISAALLGIFLICSSFFVYDYLKNRKRVAELQHLGREKQSRQAELHSVVEKISHLEEQVGRLKEMEKQIKKDFHEVNEMKKLKKIVPAVKKKPLPAREKEPVQMLRSPQPGVSGLEEERPRLMGRLRRDLFELEKEVSLRERTLAEFREFLDAQKSILMAVPSLWPVWGRITSAFRETRISASLGTRAHAGVDISAPPGTPVVAAGDGVVVSAGKESEYGLLVSLDHGYGYTTLYGHLKDFCVEPGDKVCKGQILGTVGSSGNSTGPHLHYEVRMYGDPVNPVRFLNQTS